MPDSASPPPARNNDANGVACGGLFFDSGGHIPAGYSCGFAGDCTYRFGCHLAEKEKLATSFSCAEARRRAGFWTRLSPKNS